MGHYASEMIHEGPEEKQNRENYWKTRHDLEWLRSGLFNLGEMLEIMKFLSSEPRDFEIPQKEAIAKMEKWIDIARHRK